MTSHNSVDLDIVLRMNDPERRHLSAALYTIWSSGMKVACYAHYDPQYYCRTGYEHLFACKHPITFASDIPMARSIPNISVLFWMDMIQ